MLPPTGALQEARGQFQELKGNSFSTARMTKSAERSSRLILGTNMSACGCGAYILSVARSRISFLRGCSKVNWHRSYRRSFRRLLLALVGSRPYTRVGYGPLFIASALHVPVSRLAADCVVNSVQNLANRLISR
jgi:hypothetical protein